MAHWVENCGKWRAARGLLRTRNMNTTHRSTWGTWGCAVALATAAAACGGSVKGGDAPGGPVDIAPPSCSPTCTPTSLGSLSIAKGGIVALVTDGENVYAADEGGQILSLPATGGSPTTLATIAAGYNNSLSLAVEGGNVYFAGGGEVGSVPTGGGSVTTIVSNETQATDLVATTSSLYWEDGFAVGGTPGASGTLHEVAIGAGAVDSLASDQPLYQTMATDGTSLYWSDLDGVFKLPVAGGAPTNLYGQSVLQIVADGDGIYWANDGAQTATCGVCSAPPPPTSTSSRIFHLPAGGGTPTTLATGYPNRHARRRRGVALLLRQLRKDALAAAHLRRDSGGHRVERHRVNRAGRDRECGVLGQREQRGRLHRAVISARTSRPSWDHGVDVSPVLRQPLEPLRCEDAPLVGMARALDARGLRRCRGDLGPAQRAAARRGARLNACPTVGCGGRRPGRRRFNRRPRTGRRRRRAGGCFRRRRVRQRRPVGRTDRPGGRGCGLARRHWRNGFGLGPRRIARPAKQRGRQPERHFQRNLRLFDPGARGQRVRGDRRNPAHVSRRAVRGDERIRHREHHHAP